MTRKLVFISNTNNQASNSTIDDPNTNTTNPKSILIATDSDKIKIATSFDELCKLKARSRTPIDIQQLNNQQIAINFNSSSSKASLNTQHSHRKSSTNFNASSTSNRESSLLNSSSNSGCFNYLNNSHNSIATASQATINFSQLLNKSDTKLNKTDPKPIIKNSPISSASEVASNRKYFSFLTNNKLFSSSFNINEPKLRIHNNQLIDENDFRPTSDSNERLNLGRFSEKENANLETIFGLSSSSSSSSGANSDSGCGCSIARSSILSNLDQNEAKTGPEANSDLVAKAKSLRLSEQWSNLESSSSSSSSSASASPTTCSPTSNPDRNISQKTSNNELANKVELICEQVLSQAKLNKKNDSYNNVSVSEMIKQNSSELTKSTATNRHSTIGIEQIISNISSNAKHKNYAELDWLQRRSNLDVSKNFSSQTSLKAAKARILTVLFDYESNKPSVNNANCAGFSVKKGETVKVIRDYDAKFYLVATQEGKIGFIPKDYTVDLKELKLRLKQNLKENKYMSNSNFNLNSDLSISNSYNQIFNLKLTQL
jgi:hypothetical protein